MAFVDRGWAYMCSKAQTTIPRHRARSWHFSLPKLPKPNLRTMHPSSAFHLFCFALLFAGIVKAAEDDQLRQGAANNERNLGDKAMKTGQLKTALGHYSKSIELAPKDPNGYYKRASALMIDRKYSAAERDLSTALELDPKFTMVLKLHNVFCKTFFQALSKRARMFAAQGRFESARNDLASLIHDGKGSEDINQMVNIFEILKSEPGR